MAARFTAKDVVDDLDKCIIDEPYCFFMNLEHGYFYTANSRLTLYADESRWAIVFEKNGYANRRFALKSSSISSATAYATWTAPEPRIATSAMQNI